MAKSAVLKPIPIASEAIATSANPGLFRSHLTAKRISARRDSSKTNDYSLPERPAEAARPRHDADG
jgi:hypothetical protein